MHDLVADIQLIHKTNYISLFKQYFRLWISYLLFIFLPVDLLFRVDSLLLSLFWWDLVVNTAFIIIVLLGVASIISLLELFISFGIVSTITSYRQFNYSFIPKYTNYLLLFLSCYSFAKMFKYWIYKYNYEITISSPIIALLFSVLILWKYKQNFHKRICDLTTSANAKLVLIFVACSLLLGARAILTIKKDKNEQQQIRQAWEKESPLAKEKPNIILITIDTLAAEDMSTYGYHLNTTPNISAFASTGIVFESFYANSNNTLTSMASLFTGVYPNKHLLNNINNYNYDPGTLNNNFIKHLKSNGYTTYAVSSGYMSPHPYSTGFERYFDFVNVPELKNLAIGEIVLAKCTNMFRRTDKLLHLIVGKWIGTFFAEYASYLNRYSFFLSNDIEQPVPYAPELLKEQALEIIKHQSSQPYFLWVHFFQPHNPYVTRNDLQGSFIKDKAWQNPSYSEKYQNKQYDSSEQETIDKLRLHYNESILYVDSVFGGFINELTKLEGFEKSIIVLTSDHGESFKNNFFGHNYDCLNQSVIKVPLIIGNISTKNTKSLVPGSHIDLFPTILQLVEIPKPDWALGKSLFSNLTSNSDNYVYSMNLNGNPIYKTISKGHIAAIHDNFKLVYNISNKTGKLYNLQEDKNETLDVSSLYPGVKNNLLTTLESKFLTH